MCVCQSTKVAYSLLLGRVKEIRQSCVGEARIGENNAALLHIIFILIARFNYPSLARARKFHLVRRQKISFRPPISIFPAQSNTWQKYRRRFSFDETRPSVRVPLGSGFLMIYGTDLRPILRPLSR